ncbi:MAG TPA: hypothetical protein VGK10_20120 [Prolixibacteraceae bacterium]|jgi:hypothetical protein
MKKNDILSLLLLSLTLILAGCSGTRLVKSFPSLKTLDLPTNKRESIKIHLKDGGLYVLDQWKFTKASDTIIGYGELYNYKRELIKFVQNDLSGENDQSIPFLIPEGDISLVEANKIMGNSGNIAALSIVGVPNAIYTIYCITNPKACFGSCPTFYARKNGQWALMAEGFSSSISPSFEKSDIDMLYGADQASGEMSLKLTNEALETHVIRYVDLLAFPESGEERVYATQEGQFYRASKVMAPRSCVAEEGDCLDLVKAMDRQERYGGADPKNLAQKEEIMLSFDRDGNSDSELGLLMGSKQTLLTTHLFYQVMAYTGNRYGSLVSEVENGNVQLKNRIQKLWDKLGGIEVFIQKEHKKWEKIDEINEMGPIASDVHLIKLPVLQEGKINLKLRLTKGLWRIDYLALASLVGEETPVRINPDMVLKDDSIDGDALNQLVKRDKPLVSLPGDQYELKYKLPTDCTFQFFLETKGYYLEWMRDGWLEEENLKKAAFAIYFPGLFMRKAAPEYKKAEPQMEKVFWESRYVKQ